jgi:hypothetical protein
MQSISADQTSENDRYHARSPLTAMVVDLNRRPGTMTSLRWVCLEGEAGEGPCSLRGPVLVGVCEALTAFLMGAALGFDLSILVSICSSLVLELTYRDDSSSLF